MSNTTKQKLYLIQKHDWHYIDDWYVQGGQEPVKAFRSREKAEAYFDEMIVEDFRYAPYQKVGSDREATSLDFEELVKRFQQLGVTTPEETQRLFHHEYDDEEALEFYYDWWSDTFPQLPREKRRAIYELFDKGRSYDLLEVEIDVEDVQS